MSKVNDIVDTDFISIKGLYFISTKLYASNKHLEYHLLYEHFPE